jgi:hypothetical protein
LIAHALNRTNAAVTEMMTARINASYSELAGQSKKVEENDAQYDPIPWDRMRRH